MKTVLRSLALSSLVLAPVALVAQTPAAPAASTFAEAFAAGKPALNVRLRFETADITGFRSAEALTLRTRLGYTTAPWQGLRLMLEGEHVTAADGDRYSQAGLNPAATGRAVIADVEGTEVNQAWLAYTTPAGAPAPFTATLGRQRLVLDHARFIGDVGWRQDQQTYDAFSVSTKALPGTTLTYAYLRHINRIFGNRQDWDSDSHLFNASRAALPVGTLTGYVYLLQFDQAPVNSTATYGASLAGSRQLNAGLSLSWRLEYARQTDHRNHPGDYAADYVLAEAGAAFAPVTIRVGHEILGSDRGVGFKTPLATLHAFNGWADVFLNTPAAGLRDTYVSASTTRIPGVTLTAFYHHFTADAGDTTYGDEIDLLASYKVNAHLTALAKYATFDARAGTAFRDTERFTVELNLTY